MGLCFFIVCSRLFPQPDSCVRIHDIIAGLNWSAVKFVWQNSVIDEMALDENWARFIYVWDKKVSAWVKWSKNDRIVKSQALGLKAVSGEGSRQSFPLSLPVVFLSCFALSSLYHLLSLSPLLTSLFSRALFALSTPRLRIYFTVWREQTQTSCLTAFSARLDTRLRFNDHFHLKTSPEAELTNCIYWLIEHGSMSAGDCFWIWTNDKLNWKQHNSDFTCVSIAFIFKTFQTIIEKQTQYSIFLGSCNDKWTTVSSGIAALSKIQGSRYLSGAYDSRLCGHVRMEHWSHSRHMRSVYKILLENFAPGCYHRYYNNR